MNITKHTVISIVFRYEGELRTTHWSSIRKGAAFGLFAGWSSLISYIVYAIGFIFGSFLLYTKSHNESSISDILVVSALYNKPTLNCCYYQCIHT